MAIPPLSQQRSRALHAQRPRTWTWLPPLQWAPVGPWGLRTREKCPTSGSPGTLRTGGPALLGRMEEAVLLQGHACKRVGPRVTDNIPEKDDAPEYTGGTAGEENDQARGTRSGASGREPRQVPTAHSAGPCPSRLLRCPAQPVARERSH